MKSVPSFEQETTINIYRNEPDAYIYTSDSTMMTKLDKLVKRDPEHVTVTEPDEFGRKYKMPKSYVKFHPKRAMSDKQREQITTMRSKLED